MINTVQILRFWNMESIKFINILWKMYGKVPRKGLYKCIGYIAQHNSACGVYISQFTSMMYDQNAGHIIAW